MQKGVLHKCDAKLHLCHPKTHSWIAAMPMRKQKMNLSYALFINRSREGQRGGYPQYKQGQKKPPTPKTGVDQLSTAEAEGPVRCRWQELQVRLLSTSDGLVSQKV